MATSRLVPFNDSSFLFLSGPNYLVRLIPLLHCCEFSMTKKASCPLSESSQIADWIKNSSMTIEVELI